ncbi:hypothetical protein [Mycolicibacterium sp.]|uniref:hypothetical protein n=1 Tax=Mycolicibacterium sp. TaxID=2320850 RepID=UPI0037CB5801
MTIDPEKMPRIAVRKRMTIEYTGEFAHRELAELLGLEPEHLSTSGLIEYVEEIDGDLTALHEAVEDSRDCTSSEWTVTPVR